MIAVIAVYCGDTCDICKYDLSSCFNRYFIYCKILLYLGKSPHQATITGLCTISALVGWKVIFNHSQWRRFFLSVFSLHQVKVIVHPAHYCETVQHTNVLQLMLNSSLGCSLQKGRTTTTKRSRDIESLIAEDVSLVSVSKWMNFLNLHPKFLYVLKLEKRVLWQLMTRMKLAMISLQRKGFFMARRRITSICGKP